MNARGHRACLLRQCPSEGVAQPYSIQGLENNIAHFSQQQGCSQQNSKWKNALQYRASSTSILPPPTLYSVHRVSGNPAFLAVVASCLVEI